MREEAGKFLFGNRDFKVIPNAIETERFIYKKEVRKRVRKELHFTDEFVVGHVDAFLIKIMNFYLKFLHSYIQYIWVPDYYS